MTQIFPTDDHDTVVAKYADLIRKNNPDRYQVITAAESPGRTAVPHPDIVLKDPTGKKTVLAIEIETVPTLADPAAPERWKSCAAKFPALQVAVPKGTLKRAKRLGKHLGAKIRFLEY